MKRVPPNDNFPDSTLSEVEVVVDKRDGVVDISSILLGGNLPPITFWLRTRTNKVHLGRAVVNIFSFFMHAYFVTFVHLI